MATGKPVAPSIYKDTYGYEVRACANKITHIRRFGPDATLKTMKAWQESERATIRRDKPALARHTFAADAETYLKKVERTLIPGVFSQRQQVIAWWTEHLGHLRRDRIRPEHIDAALTTLDKAPGTWNRYRNVLAHLWATMDGKSCYNPVRDIKRRKEPLGSPKAIPEETLRLIFSQLGEGKMQSRIRLMIETGFSQEMIRHLKPGDIDLVNRTITAPERHKGSGVPMRVLPLTDGGFAAAAEFVKWDAFGAFSNQGIRRPFIAACRAAGVVGVRPYDLRHTFLSHIMSVTQNIDIAKVMAQHASRATTERYVRAAVPGMVRDAIRSLSTVH